MPYFNGGIHGWNGPRGYEPPAPCTAVYCDACAPAAIPLPPLTDANRGRQHWETGFKWAPYYGKRACTCCGDSVDMPSGQKAAEVATGGGQYRAGRGAIVTDWQDTEQQARAEFARLVAEKVAAPRQTTVDSNRESL